MVWRCTHYAAYKVAVQSVELARGDLTCLAKHLLTLERVMKKLFFLLLFLPLYADQPFEPIFLTGGVAPLVAEPTHPSLLQLRSGEQFVRLVGNAAVPAVIKIDKLARAGAAEQTDVLAQVVDEWPRPLCGYTVDAAAQAKLTSAIVSGVGGKQVALPSYIIFYKGKGVMPVIHGAQTLASLRAALAQRLTYVQQQESAGWAATLVDWWRMIYARMTSLLRGMWTTLVGSFAA